MQNYSETLISQYANSPTIVSLIKTFNHAIDPEIDLDQFYKKIWDISTATGYGLDVWGKIVGVSRLLQFNSVKKYLSFNESSTRAESDQQPQPFNQSPLYTTKPETTTYSLSDDAYRTLIMVKAMTNITDSTAPNLNKLLGYLFKDRRCYVVDTGDMSLRYVFEFDLSELELSIISNSGAIARPAGVRAQVMQIDRTRSFGFAETRMQTFGHGAFFNHSNLIDI